MKRTLLALACAAAAIAGLYGQARSAPDWTTAGGDAQRTSWMPVDPYISADSVAKFQFIWKLKLDNESRHGRSLTTPVALGNLMTFRGFKSLIFVGGSSNNVYALDYDFGTVFWQTRHSYLAGPREFAGSPACPGGMTAPLTRATGLTPPSQLSFFGFARPPRPAKGDVGEPGKGAPQLAEIAAQQAARDASARTGDTAAAGRAGAPAAPSAPARTPPPNFVFSIAADGLLRAIIPDTGDLALAPVPFLPANATATGLIWSDGQVYAAVTNQCGGAAPGVFGMDFEAPAKPVSRWNAGAAIAGLSLGPDGTVYVTTGDGPSEYADSVVALEPRTLKPKDWIRQESPFVSAPSVFTESGETVVAAVTANRLYLLGASSLGGADHKTPMFVTADASTKRSADSGVATWRDAAGTRWIVTELAGSVIAHKMVGVGGRKTLEQAWKSDGLRVSRTPMIVNGVVFALAGGDAGTGAVLHALDSATGRQQWSSGGTMTSPASDGLSTGTGQVFVVTRDNTVWAFGIPLAIN
jgi:outer membrane protein assembly factor BamB